MYTVRFFDPTDDEYAAIVAVQNAVWPDERQHTARLWRENDDEWPSTALHQRFVVESRDSIIGQGACYEQYWQHQHGTVHIDFHIHPAYGTAGVDELLYDFILDFLRARTPQPVTLATRAREDRLERVQLLRDRGFVPAMRFPRASLNVAGFDAGRFDGVRSQVGAQGIHIHTLSELRRQEPDWERLLCELRWATIQDMPAVEPPTRPSLSEFQTMILDDPALNPDGWFVAIDPTRDVSCSTGPLVGMSNLWVNDPTRERLDAGLTGVIRGYRRRGIATALKVYTIEFAQRLGALTIETANEENNPMYALNLRLGFVPKPAWISYRRAFSSAGPSATMLHCRRLPLAQH
jgi:mycothiol synthase